MRGVAIAIVIFVHVAIAQYAGIKKINFFNSSLFVKAFIFFATSAGIFAIVTGISNTYTYYHRVCKERVAVERASLWLFISGIFLIILHSVDYFLLGLRTLEIGKTESSILMNLILKGEWRIPSIEGLLINSALSAWGICMILTSFFELRN